MEFRKDLFADERNDDLNIVGKGVQRQDALGHVTGRSPFYDDRNPAGMLHLKCLRSPHEAARIRSVDVSAAERSPGVRRAIRGADVPVNLNTLLSLIQFGEDDEPSLAVDAVRYQGEPIVAVVADSEREAYEAIAKIRVDYEPITPILDVEEALAPGARQVNPVMVGNAFTYFGRYNHMRIRFGDFERACREADVVLGPQRYQMSPIEHAPTETNGCVVVPETNDRVSVYSCAQALYFSLDTTAKILDLSPSRLHFIGGTVGGGFGGKVDTLTEPLATLACLMTGRPIRYRFNRAEEMQVSAPRGAERIFITDALSRDGRILGRRFVNYFDAGAYSRLSPYAGHKCAAHLPGPYTIANVSADIYCVYTNRTPATAMRGFGVTGVDFAIERQMDKSARALGMDPLEFRILNAYRDGDMKAHRRVAKNCALIECAQVTAEKAGWPLSAEAKALSSRQGGGGPRAEVPHTPPDGGAARPAGAAAPVESPPAAAPVSSAAAEPQRRPDHSAAAGRTPPAPTEPKRPTRHGVARFSSVLGRRR